MSKIMVVEDDAALREIYSIRITAEGYDVVSAGDGEEALAMTVREKPDLILSDVMMPKISGFDMLDIIRATPETAHIKVVMMTALSADDQRARGESLGADRYLVKSQVGIEDVINVIHEVLGDKPAQSTNSTPEPAKTSEPAPVPEPAKVPTIETVLASASAQASTNPNPTFNPFAVPTPTIPNSTPTTPQAPNGPTTPAQ